jgi:hypothetical protein
MNMWPDVVLVHGRPRHPQTQGSIERANQDIEPMIGNWMIDNNTKNWVLGLNFVQIAKNTRYHSGVGNKPYTLRNTGNNAGMVALTYLLTRMSCRS